DFLTGSMFGNKKDLDRVRDIYKIPYRANLPVNSPVRYIRDQIDYLASGFYKIDYFEFSFNNPVQPEDPISIIAFKVKPKAGVQTPEDVALFVDGDLNLRQKGYQSMLFQISGTEIKFTHNARLKPEELSLIISLPGREERILFSDIIASKTPDEGWISGYAVNNSRDLMEFDSVTHTYHVPPMRITLDSSINQKDFENLVFGYKFRMDYDVQNSGSVGLIYKTERAVPINNVLYASKTTIIVMYYLVPAAIAVMLIIFLVLYGRPTDMFFHIDGYLDSIERIDYNRFGKLLTPYLAWKNNRSFSEFLVRGELKYRSEGYPLNWNPNVLLRFREIQIPEGFEIYLKADFDDIREFGNEFPLKIKKNANNRLSFVVGIRQNDINRKVMDPEQVRFLIDAGISSSILFLQTELSKPVPYRFHIGPDLEDVWMGIDPGTTSSCLAVGSHTDNIVLGKDVAGQEIIPSIVAFELDNQFQENGRELVDMDYYYGSDANARISNEARYKSFQSLKKLLGYKDKKEIRFNSGNTLTIEGKALAGLLVKGLYADMEKYFCQQDTRNEEYKRQGSFDPKRAVVAIPNNFTAGKIQDMIECISRLDQFKEIRYIYEAEAVLFYYLSNFRKLNPQQPSFDSEAILVFDMGGATINATVVVATAVSQHNRSKYDIDLMAKIGYGIGGDTIDFCICNFILGFRNEFPQLNEISLLENKIPLGGLALEIKKEIINNFYSNKDYLITAFNLERFIGKYLNLQIGIDESSSPMYSYFKKGKNGRYPLFEHPDFTRIIYNNVQDAVREVIQLSNNIMFDKVIFSGRSTAFPLIKETVEIQLQKNSGNVTIVELGLEESKTAVAKGACWYGINKNSIRLHHVKTNAAFGYKKTLTADTSDARFYELVAMGEKFESSNGRIDSRTGLRRVDDDFSFDGSKVNFYQVMGKDADKILSENQKHKFSRIASVALPQIASEVAIKVYENDTVECAVRLETKQVLKESGVVADQEISEANEEHYTWLVM
ncbi:MAG: Hsp70 family protein, partial [Cyclobacteriaceae bacterium]|nr:Hsp70 family protein [Cyclobacteriaceae bacterium]